MCYPKPGPRCSYHARNKLVKLENELEETKYPALHFALRKKVDDARKEYRETPEGIKSLREEGMNDLADVYEQERAEKIRKINEMSERNRIYSPAKVTLTEAEEIDGEAAIVEHAKDGSYTHHFFEGKPKRWHRDGDKPAFLKYNAQDQLKYEYYYQHGRRHRDGDKPAVVHYDTNGRTRIEKYYKNDRPHRDGNKPFLIEYDGKGKITKTRHYEMIDGDKVQVTKLSDGRILHTYHHPDKGSINRDGDQPAVIGYREDGTKYTERYYRNNRPFREDGKPNIVNYDRRGNVI